ncbi:MAG: hypothetical protein ABSA97_12620 [Verrucomicrobiia bacterium]
MNPLRGKMHHTLDVILAKDLVEILTAVQVNLATCHESGRKAPPTLGWRRRSAAAVKGMHLNPLSDHSQIKRFVAIGLLAAPSLISL